MASEFRKPTDLADLKLEHYASSPIELDRDRTYDLRPITTYRKPAGFWVSVKGEYDWPSFCRDEDFALASLNVKHNVKLKPDANVLLLSDPAQTLAFHERFAVEGEWARRYGDPHKDWPIEWERVAALWDGIIIAPYQWVHRMNLGWYYTWDVASGCIWNLDAIESVKVAQ